MRRRAWSPIESEFVLLMMDYDLTLINSYLSLDLDLYNTIGNYKVNLLTQ